MLTVQGGGRAIVETLLRDVGGLRLVVVGERWLGDCLRLGSE